ncbi:endonuclease III [Prosthecochloris sp. SCSIO W1101]|uniref:endonuclease III n=1 Tax=Prosthecochloris sp. SCSIO W1101 TaxID=2992242 RepID=UPI00223D2D4E|nr:endonuclease III [Prosthecochloris sp. SCSIO W1101]UZJ40956.1 endonuclease III [Prosthecochloris sp. SCSIO W1101]
MTIQEKIAFINLALGEKYPSPKSELKHSTPFQLLVATILSAQSTDKQVNIITSELFKICPDAESMSRMELDQLKTIIRSINYFNNKAKNILEASKMIVGTHNGETPSTREELENLPGVGRKTANVVLSNAFHQPVMPVDTHVHRVSNRIGLVTTDKPRDTEDALVAVIPPELVIPFHHYLVLHGRYVCKARKPLCAECPITAACSYPDKTV